MGAFSFLRSVYDLDTLDTRFTNASNTPYKTVVDTRDDPIVRKEKASKFGSRVRPSKWRSPEFCFYYLALAFLVPYMFRVAYDASNRMFAAHCNCRRHQRRVTDKLSL